MKKQYIVIMCIIILVLMMGAGKKFYLSQYEEECYEYKLKVITYNWTSWDYEPEGCEWLWCITCQCELVTEIQFINFTTNTEECIKYHLVRKV